jgi:alanyl-tRNA synthetase
MSINGYSKEICGGPHAKNTKELGSFKILKEESSSSGVRRIKRLYNKTLILNLLNCPD